MNPNTPRANAEMAKKYYFTFRNIPRVGFTFTLGQKINQADLNLLNEALGNADLPILSKYNETTLQIPYSDKFHEYIGKISAVINKLGSSCSVPQVSLENPAAAAQQAQTANATTQSGAPQAPQAASLAPNAQPQTSPAAITGNVASAIAQATKLAAFSGVTLEDFNDPDKVKFFQAIGFTEADFALAFRGSDYMFTPESAERFKRIIKIRYTSLLLDFKNGKIEHTKEHIDLIEKIKARFTKINEDDTLLEKYFTKLYKHYKK